MKNSKIKIFIAIAIIVLAGVAFWFFLSSEKDQRQISAPVSEKSADMSETYTNPKYSFSFSHPKEFSVSEFIENGADIILLKDAAAGGVFQVLVSSFDEPEPITKARILKDIPNMAIANDKIISLGGEKALSFRSKDKSGSETFEIWFARNGNLYQISALPDFEEKLKEIVKKWTFK